MFEGKDRIFVEGGLSILVVDIFENYDIFNVVNKVIKKFLVWLYIGKN